MYHKTKLKAKCFSTQMTRITSSDDCEVDRMIRNTKIEFYIWVFGKALAKLPPHASGSINFHDFGKLSVVCTRNLAGFSCICSYLVYIAASINRASLLQ